MSQSCVRVSYSVLKRLRKKCSQFLSMSLEAQKLTELDDLCVMLNRIRNKAIEIDQILYQIEQVEVNNRDSYFCFCCARTKFGIEMITACPSTKVGECLDCSKNWPTKLREDLLRWYMKAGVPIGEH